MSQDNVEAFRQTAEAISQGAVEAALALVAEDAVVKAARSAVQGDYLGHDGVRQFFADNAESFEVFQLNLHEVRDLGDKVLAIGTIRLRGREGGVETEVPMAGVAVFRSGKLSRWEDFRDRRLALEAVGLRE
jgi:ketosteroid isomerase-like protein